MVAIENAVEVVPIQVPIQAPPQVRAPPVGFMHNSSFIVPSGIVVVRYALERLNVPCEVRGPFQLTFALAGREPVEVEVNQYRRADGETIVEFHRIFGCTVEFNNFLRGELVEQLRNYGIARLDRGVVPRRDYLPPGLPLPLRD